MKAVNKQTLILSVFLAIAMLPWAGCDDEGNGNTIDDETVKCAYPLKPDPDCPKPNDGENCADFAARENCLKKQCEDSACAGNCLPYQVANGEVGYFCSCTDDLPFGVNPPQDNCGLPDGKNCGFLTDFPDGKACGTGLDNTSLCSVWDTRRECLNAQPCDGTLVEVKFDGELSCEDDEGEDVCRPIGAVYCACDGEVVPDEDKYDEECEKPGDGGGTGAPDPEVIDGEIGGVA